MYTYLQLLYMSLKVLQQFHHLQLCKLQMGVLDLVPHFL